MFLQLGLVAALAGGGYALGDFLGVRKGAWWLLGFGAALVVIGAVVAVRRVVRLDFVAPLGWLGREDVNYLVMAPAVTLLFATLVPRLGMRRKRVAVWVVMGAMLAYHSVLPVVLPAAVRGSLLATPTRIDRRGVCLQTHEYTCGAAAAVTALRRLGLEGSDVAEGVIGAEAGTAPARGTDPWLLAEAINRRFGSQGVTAEYQWVGTLPALREALATEGDEEAAAVVSINYAVLMNHYVTVLAILRQHVLVGDPQSGQQMVENKDFAEEWNGAAIIVRRKVPVPAIVGLGAGGH